MSTVGSIAQLYIKHNMLVSMPMGTCSHAHLYQVGIDTVYAHTAGIDTLCLIKREMSIEQMIRLRIKEIAESKGISQRKLAKLTGIDIKGIQRIFREPTPNVTLQTLDRLAKALGVNASELIDSVDER